MRVTWEETDIRAGRIVGKPTRQERWMIGYCHGHQADSKTERCYTMNSLTDGMVQTPIPAKTLAVSLTESGELPFELFESEWRHKFAATPNKDHPNDR